VTHFFKLHPSRICSALLFAVYSLAILITLMLPIAAWARAALAVLLVCCLVYYLRRDGWLLSASSSVAINLQGNNIVLLARNGDEMTGQLLRDSLVTPALTILNVLPRGKKRARSVVIFPDSLDRERNRELRVLLKWAVEVERQ
jgi:hypothetical protein